LLALAALANSFKSSSFSRTGTIPPVAMLFSHL
jgi:hypothetical protein